ncbi:hypothetical protein K7X08_001328 [Anisodus acutangulus]|uniref:Uncharacterized protein n=1 Tax=Anisodus acutangulus TaxID=402998 RepID=A0A9Q1MRU0_9SOLA|nr:hypothetical protein K7X08_001328 [Anisodus acutangulus]
MSSRSSSDFQNPRIFSSTQNPNPRESFFGSDDFDPSEFLQTHLASRRAGGVNFEFVIEGGNVGSLPLPANMGDYFIGPGFEELIQHLAENDPNRYGTPPASKSAVEGLPSIKVDEELLRSELAQCAVCKDDFELGDDRSLVGSGTGSRIRLKVTWHPCLQLVSCMTKLELLGR